MASDRKLNIYNEDNVTINVVEESDNQLTIINESPTVEVITIYEQGPQGPRGEKGEGADLPTEIISGSGANNLLALFVNSGYITGSKNLSFDGSNLSISGSVYISTFSGSAVSLAGISQDNNLTNIAIGSGLNLLDNTLNAVGSLTGTGSITQLAFWTASKAISGSQNLVYDYTNGRLGINNSNPQYALDVSGTVHLSGSLINVSHIDFSTSSYSTNAPARITWNPDFGTLDLGVVGGNVNLSWGLEVAAYVVNGEADTLVDGEVVYMSGSRGDKPKVYRASSLTELTSTKTFGVVTEPILSNQLGYVTTQGVVNGLNLSSFNPGDAVWLGTTPGTFTATKPQAPTHSVFVGIVQRANAGDGQLYVRVQNGYEIDELHNVRITNPLNGQLLTYNQAQQIWVNGNTLSGSYFVSGSIQATAFTGSSGLFNSLYITGSSNSALLVIDSPASQNIICVSGSGNIGIGINNPAYRLDVSGTTQVRDSLRIVRSDNNSFVTSIYQSSVAGLNFEGTSFDFQRAGTTFARLAQNSTVTYWVHRMNINVPNVITDIGAALGVRGSGTTSATTTFRAENSAGTAGFFVRDDGYFFNGDSTFQVRPYATGGTTAIINNGGHNGAQGLQVTSAVGIVAASSLGASVNNPNGASIYAQGGAQTGNISLGLLSNRALISAGNARSMQNSAMLQVDSTTLGFLLPRMTSTQRNAIASASQGLMVYTTTPADEGVYYYNSGSSYQGWTRLLNSSGSQTLTGSLNILGTLNTSVYSGSSAYISGDVYVGGKVTAQEFYTQYVSSSIIYQSGSTKFGDSLDDIHQRTGSLNITGSVNIAGNLNSTGDTRLTIGSGTSIKLQGALGGALTYAYAEYISGQYTAGLRSDTNMSLRSGDTSRIYISNTNVAQGITLFGNNLGLNVLTPTAKLHISGSSGSGLFEIDSDSNQNIIYVSGSGNVGIGTNTPAYKLDVIGNGRFRGSGTTSATYGFQVHNSTGTNNGLVVRDDGRVGINTTSLTAELTVNGGVSATVLTASNSGGIFFPASLFRIYKPGSYLGHEYSMDWSMQDGHVFTKNSNTSIGMTTGNIRNLSSQGGINLDSAGNANYYPLFISYTIANTSNQTGNATGIYLRANESNLRGMSHNLIDLGNASGSIFNVTNRGVAYISSSLGIGTANPAYTLDVVGSGDFSGGLTVTGSFQLSGSLFQYSDNTDVDIGTEVVTSVPTSSYRSAFFDYVITSGSNARAGTVFSVWGGSTVEYTETSTNDIGSTTPVSLFVALNGANVELRATTTADNWSVKSLARML